MTGKLMAPRSNTQARRPSSSAPPLEQRFSYMFHRISARVALIGNRHFKFHGLNHYSARILVLLLERGPLRTGELVELMLLPQSTISTQLQVLHRRRLVSRRRAYEDNRGVTVALTDPGRIVATDCDDLSRRVQAILSAAFSRAEMEATRALLGRIDACLSRIQDETLLDFRRPARGRRSDGWAPARV